MPPQSNTLMQIKDQFVRIQHPRKDGIKYASLPIRANACKFKRPEMQKTGNAGDLPLSKSLGQARDHTRSRWE